MYNVDLDWYSTENPPSEFGVYVVKTRGVFGGTGSLYISLWEDNRFKTLRHPRSERVSHWRPLVESDLIFFAEDIGLFNKETQEFILNGVKGS